MVHELSIIARDAGIVCQIEPRSDDCKVRNRLDIRMVGPLGVLLVDVSICQPTAESYRPEAAKSAGSATRAREAIKRANYGNIAKDEGATLFPFETFGHIGEEAQKLLRAITK